MSENNEEKVEEKEETSKFYEVKEKYSYNHKIKNDKISTEKGGFSVLSFTNKEIILKIKELPNGDQFVFGVGDKNILKHFKKLIKCTQKGDFSTLPKEQKIKAHMCSIKKNETMSYTNINEMQSKKNGEKIVLKQLKKKDIISIKIDEEKKKLYFFQNGKKTTIFKNLDFEDLFLFLFLDQSFKAKLLNSQDSNEDEE
jgi:hypothetical protein